LTTSPPGHATRGWLRFGGAILFVLAVAACGPAATVPAGSVGTSASPLAPGPSSAAPAAPSGAAVPAATLLGAALEPLQKAASFETRVEVDGSVVVSASGRSVGAASRLTMTTADRTVEYLQVPPRAWAREPGAAWVLVDTGQAPAAPLDVLSNPLTLATATSADGRTSFAATYPAAALGLEGDPVAVAITVEGTAVTFRYESTTSGHRTLSTTTLRPSTADPIVAPAP
jgi:hypothetical protein